MNWREVFFCIVELVHLRDFLLSKQITDGVDKRGVVVTSRLLSRFDNPNTQTF